MTDPQRDPARPRTLADPSAASRRLAWLLTLAVHLALVGAWLATSAWRIAPPPAPTPASLVLRLSPPAPAPAPTAPAPAPPEPVRPVTPPPEPRPEPKPTPPRPSQARPRPAPAPVAPTAPAAPAETPPVAAAPAAPAAPAPAPAALAAPRPDPAEAARRQDMLDALAAMLEREKRYPLAARRGGLSGRLLLLVQFDAQGRPTAWQVLEGDAPEVLCRAALEAMERASRRLADGLPLLAGRRVRVPMHFQLE